MISTITKTVTSEDEYENKKIITYKEYYKHAIIKKYSYIKDTEIKHGLYISYYVKEEKDNLYILPREKGYYKNGLKIGTWTIRPDDKSQYHYLDKYNMYMSKPSRTKKRTNINYKLLPGQFTQKLIRLQREYLCVPYGDIIGYTPAKYEYESQIVCSHCCSMVCCLTISLVLFILTTKFFYNYYHTDTYENNIHNFFLVIGKFIQIISGVFVVVAGIFIIGFILAILILFIIPLEDNYVI